MNNKNRDLRTDNNFQIRKLLISRLLSLFLISNITTRGLLSLLMQLIRTQRTLRLTNTRNNLGQLTGRLPILVGLALSSINIQISKLGTTRRINRNRRKMTRHKASITLNNQVNRVTLPAKFRRHNKRNIRRQTTSFRINFNILRAGQISLIQRNKKADNALSQRLNRRSAKSMRPRIRARIIRSTINIKSNKMRLNLPIITFSLHNRQIPNRTRTIHSRFTKSNSPISVQTNNRINTRHTNHTISLTRMLLIFSILRLAIRAMSMSNRLLTRHNQHN